MSLLLQAAAADDLGRLLPLVRSYHEFEGVPLDDRTRESVLRALLGESDRGRVYLLREHGEVTGYVALCFGYSIEFGGRDAFVDEFFIAEPFRGRGLSRRALDLVIEEAGRLGVRALHLEVAGTNLPAQKMYASAGFVPRAGFHLMSRRL